MIDRGKLLERLIDVYGPEQAKHLDQWIVDSVSRYSDGVMSKAGLDQSDILLIVYGDQVREIETLPLASLRKFAEKYLQGVVSAIHILPFYPFTSDDGFSVVDYKAVNPAWGNWEDVRELAEDFDLMFDAVVNHISAKSAWFQKYLVGDRKYREFFIEADPEADYSSVTRPRALPLLTEVETTSGSKHVWTTFSADQIDLNFRNPAVFLAVLDVLLFYVSQGARFIRLDAIGYLWKEKGTSCIHLPETHKIIQAYRQILEHAAPNTIIVTETNVPHNDNISYFGQGSPEAHMVYQFPLPPLTLYSYIAENTEILSRWAATIKTTDFPVPGTTYFNFLASHDGIGLLPTRGLLNDTELASMITAVQDRGGYVSYKDNGDGTKSPYEMNINYLSALSQPEDTDQMRVDKMLGAHTILLSLAGVPGIYFHSLVGSQNDLQAVKDSGIPRRINREKLDLEQLTAELNDSSSVRHAIYRGLKQRLQQRRRLSAFHPDSYQEVLELDSRLFVVLRGDSESQVLAVVNTSSAVVEFRWQVPYGNGWHDVLNEDFRRMDNGCIIVQVQPYASHWFVAAEG